HTRCTSVVAIASGFSSVSRCDNRNSVTMTSCARSSSVSAGANRRRPRIRCSVYVRSAFQSGATAAGFGPVESSRGLRVGRRGGQRCWRGESVQSSKAVGRRGSRRALGHPGPCAPERPGPLRLRLLLVREVHCRSRWKRGGGRTSVGAFAVGRGLV